jgi:cell division protein FtsX
MRRLVQTVALLLDACYQHKLRQPLATLLTMMVIAISIALPILCYILLWKISAQPLSNGICNLN